MAALNSWDLLVSTERGVARFDGGTGAPRGVFVRTEGVPTGLRFGPEGDLWVGCVGPDVVARFDGKTGAFIATAAKHPDLVHPRQVAFRDDMLLVSSRGRSVVLAFATGDGGFKGQFSKASPRYAITGVHGAGREAAKGIAKGRGSGREDVGEDGLNQPFGLIHDPQGHLLVASYGTDSVRRYDGRTGVFIGTFACGHGLEQPRNIVYGPDGNLYVTSANHAVIRYDGTTGEFIDVFVEPGAGGLDDPYGLEFGADGNLYVISGGNSRVLRFEGRSGRFLDTFVSAEGDLVKASYAAFVGGLGGAYKPEGWRAVLGQ